MRIKEGVSFEQSDGTWQKPEIELDDIDFERIMTEWEISDEKAKSLDVSRKYKILSTYAQYLLIARYVKSRLKDEAWIKNEGEPMFKEIAAELGKVRTSIG